MYIPIPPPISKRNMKELKIQNVQKLEGYVTTSYHNDYKKFICTSVTNRYESYDFTFTNSKWHTIQVSVLKMPHTYYDHHLATNHIGYTALIRHSIEDDNVSEWWSERPFLTQIGVSSKDEFLRAMGELCNRYVKHIEETEYKNSPWYNKFWDKTKEFIHSI